MLLYNYINNVDLIHSANDYLSLTKTVNNYNSTSFLLKNFFDRLQDKMSSTITTVIGTADKLMLKCDTDAEIKGTCSFCLSYLDEVYNDLEIGSIDTISNE